MDTLNLGILAHVDAGKTSLTERLLYAAGVIDHIGRVDDGDTQTDTLVLERQRGITIKSAVVSFEINGRVVNLIDTPGHPDFIAEVERVLNVLDGVILVVSAVEGVQPQTRVLMRTLRRLGLPVLIFVNKIDRRGARSEALLREIAAKLGIDVVPMGSVRDLGTKRAAFVPYAVSAAEVVVPLADHDDRLLTAYLSDRPMTAERVRGELAELTRTGRVHPVFFGSAITGAGVAELTAGIVALLPTAGGDTGAEPSGSVFGWQVTDCRVTLIHTGYFPRQSRPRPVRQVDDQLAATMTMLAEVRAIPYETTPQGASFVLEGDVPSAQVHALTRLLPGVTAGWQLGHGESFLRTTALTAEARSSTPAASTDNPLTSGTRSGWRIPCTIRSHIRKPSVATATMKS